MPPRTRHRATAAETAAAEVGKQFAAAAREAAAAEKLEKIKAAANLELDDWIERTGPEVLLALSELISDETASNTRFQAVKFVAQALFPATFPPPAVHTKQLTADTPDDEGFTNPFDSQDDDNADANPQ